ncbi:MAG TPA: heparan-alpha-glucosaminide N-acetyltransferase domain-containing protein [Candidatus Binatia bacterium]|nr:heparan-alpha-glucosaminide N-acetyltransferase domain-containing protein [Candidatus Binatia bacterium]
MLAEAEPLPRVPRVRRLALDRLRGIVMVLMAIDHASGVFNAGRLVTDGATLYRPGTVLPAAQFLTRWITHLCAPTFVFLAGAALALSVNRRRALGDDERTIDRFIASRGLFIAALDPLWMSWVFAPGHVLLQVLYAIGFGLVAMVPLRRLPDRAVLVTGLVLAVAGEAITGLVLAADGGTPGIATGLLLTGGQFGPVIVAYPLVPWLAMMLLGWWFGGFVQRSGAERARGLVAVASLVVLATFLLVRGADGYGNMRLLRDDGSLVQWLHVSKYPPALAYTTLELGLAAAILAGLLSATGPRDTVAGPLAVLGQTALFFYVLHVHVLVLVGRALHLEHATGIAGAYVGGLAITAALYPLCARYRRYKRAHPDGWARYL